MRVLSYNIHKGIGGRDRRYRLQRIIDVIEAENPDVICLQEVDRHVPRSGNDDQPRLLREYFRSEQSIYQRNVTLKSGGYGNLMLSRWPMIDHHHLSITMRFKKARGAQLAQIDSPEGPFLMVNWHLGLADFERRWQVRHLLEHRLFRESEELPTVIVGDFNDWRNTLQRAAFDAYGFEQVTHPPSRFRSFPAWLRVGSLDKAFVRGVRVKDARIVSTRLSREASDHLPLVVDLHLEPR